MFFSISTANTLTLWNFANEMQVGDIIFSKKGLTKLVGYGRVASAYRYDQTIDEEFAKLRTLVGIADELEKEEYSDVLDFIDVFDDVARNGWEHARPHNVVPLFEEAISQLIREDASLGHYRDILAEYGIDWSSRSMAEFDVSNADERCLKALLVGLFRGDHFSNGTMERFIREGTVGRWLRRLKKIMQSEAV